MPECSLCAGPLPPEGGIVLFADARGIPFEVCGNCEEKIDLLRSSSDEAEAGRALEYISECARNLGRRDVYDSLASFIQGARPAEPEDMPDEGAGEEQPEEYEQSGSEAAPIGGESGIKRSTYKPVLIGVILVVILVLVLVFGVHPLG